MATAAALSRATSLIFGKKEKSGAAHRGRRPLPSARAPGRRNARSGRRRICSQGGTPGAQGKPAEDPVTHQVAGGTQDVIESRDLRTVNFREQVDRESYGQKPLHEAARVGGRELLPKHRTAMLALEWVWQPSHVSSLVLARRWEHFAARLGGQIRNGPYFASCHRGNFPVLVTCVFEFDHFSFCRR